MLIFFALLASTMISSYAMDPSQRKREVVRKQYTTYRSLRESTIPCLVPNQAPHTIKNVDTKGKSSFDLEILRRSVDSSQAEALLLAKRKSKKRFDAERKSARSARRLMKKSKNQNSCGICKVNELAYPFFV